jgi:uncharacterized protein (TIGR00369 family)
MAEEKKYALGPIFGAGIKDMLHHTPHARRLGMQVVETGPGFAIVTLPYAPEIVGDPSRGVVFGGVITTLLDQTSGLAIACAMEELRPIATVDLRVDYLRAAEPGRDLFARVDCTKVTRNVAFIHGVAWEHRRDDPFANCLGTFMIGANPVLSPGLQKLAEAQAQSERERAAEVDS